MYWRVILCMFFVMSDVQAAAGGVDFMGVSYRQFISCYFQGNHEFTQQLNAVIKQQARLGNGVIFDEPVVIGFSSRKPSNSGFYVNYEQYDCVPNFETMQSLCSIEVSGFKYGSVPSSYKKVYLDTLRSELVKRGQDSALLDGFVTALVRGFNDDQYGVEIDGLGVFSYDAKKSAVVFQSIPLNQFDAVVAQPIPISALNCVQNSNTAAGFTVAQAGQGTVAVTSSSQLLQQSLEDNLKVYYYPRYSTVTLTATPASGFVFDQFSCTSVAGNNSNVTSTLNPFTVTMAGISTRCDVYFKSTAPAAPEIGSSTTSVEILSVTGSFPAISPNLVSSSLKKALLFLRYGTYPSTANKLYADLQVYICKRYPGSESCDFYDEEDGGDVIYYAKGDYVYLENLALNTEYTLSSGGITVRFKVNGWGLDTIRVFDMIPLLQ